MASSWKKVFADLHRIELQVCVIELESRYGIGPLASGLQLWCAVLLACRLGQDKWQRWNN